MPLEDGQRPLVISTTVPDAEVARRLARELVERRLVACVQIAPGLTSVYRWQGRIEESSELALTIKTVRRHLPAIERAFGELHPYAVPEFVVFEPTHVAGPYASWLAAETEAP